jgi:uncharacterized protein YbaP (TraB family)
MKRAISLVAALLLAGCFDPGPQPPTAPRPDPALWIAHGPHAAAVLFGSVHALPTRMDWESRAMEIAIAHADEIWFETPLDAQSGYQLALALSMKSQEPRGKTLWDRLTPAEAAKVRQAAARLDVKPDKLAHLQPWAAILVLGGKAGGETGVTSDWGVERVLDAQSGPHTRREAFETPAEHAAVLTGASTADQIAMLDATANAAIAGEVEDEARMVRQWREGDVAGLARDTIAKDVQTMPGMYRRLLPDRNRRFADAIAKRLRGKGFIIVVVGAGHMIGPEGVPALLRARGIPVDGPLTH